VGFRTFEYLIEVSSSTKELFDAPNLQSGKPTGSENIAGILKAVYTIYPNLFFFRTSL